MDNKELHFRDINHPENIDKIYLVLINGRYPRKLFVQYKGDNKFIHFKIEGHQIRQRQDDMNVVFPNNFAENGDDVSFIEFKIPMDIFNKFFILEPAGGKRKTYKKRKRRRMTKKNYKTNKQVKR